MTLISTTARRSPVLPYVVSPAGRLEWVTHVRRNHHYWCLSDQRIFVIGVLTKPSLGQGYGFALTEQSRNFGWWRWCT